MSTRVGMRYVVDSGGIKIRTEKRGGGGVSLPTDEGIMISRASFHRKKNKKTKIQRNEERV